MVNVGEIIKAGVDVVVDVLDKDDKPQPTVVLDVTPPATAPVTERAMNAAASWEGGFAGVLLIIGALLVDPTFSRALGEFTVKLATGDGGWGALAALIGTGLVAYRRGR